MMAPNPILRFAPSPNGRLHLGHAFSALFTARAAAALGGTMRLRVEDIDPARSKPEFDAGLIDDLHWLGLSWPEPVLRQSTRLPAYAAAATRLRERGLLYPCFCTRKEVAARATGTDPDGAPLYPGMCRALTPGDVASRRARGDRPQWRLAMSAAIAAAGPLMIWEAPAAGIDAGWDQLARRPAEPGRWGDVVLVRKDTPTSYHLSVVVDDAFEAVTHVTRGLDLKSATDLHVLLQRLLDLPSPHYCHHALILDAARQKLAKSRGSTSLRDRREAGQTSADIRKALGFA
jgi:glutamyl-Q tRNA(Asp) synthetase